MDQDEQEFAELNTDLNADLAASDAEYSRQSSAALDLYFEQIRGVSEEEKTLYSQQYRQKVDALLQACIARNHATIETYMRRKDALEERIEKSVSAIISPFWRVRVTHILEEAPPHLKSFFTRELEANSRETLHEYFRFFLENPNETVQASPLEVEVIRVTHEESLVFLKGYEKEDRAVYHVDFRLPQQRDLIGHDHVQNEIIGAWVCIGGQFIHRVTDYDHEGRPIRFQDHIHRPIPKEYIQ
jgi:hypothetical protein